MENIELDYGNPTLRTPTSQSVIESNRSWGLHPNETARIYAKNHCDNLHDESYSGIESTMDIFKFLV